MFMLIITKKKLNFESVSKFDQYETRQVKLNKLQLGSALIFFSKFKMKRN